MGAYTVTALVTRTGFIRRFAVTFTDTQNNRISVRFRYTAVDTTNVSQPGWVSRLRATASDDPPILSTTRAGDAH